MKKLLKIVFVIVVIAGLMASYVFIGSPVSTTQQAATQEALDFEGPANAPSTNGPDGLPPVN